MIEFAPPAVDVERREDGTVVLSSRHPLGDYPRHTGDLLRSWSQREPSRVFLMERRDDGSIRRTTYGEARIAAESVGQALVDLGAGPERPILVLSENAIDHALVMFSAMHAGVPVAPISPAYSLQSKDFVKLRAIGRLFDKPLVYASSGVRYGRALDALGVSEADIVTSDGARGLPFSELLRTSPTQALEEKFRQQTPDALAKVLFTSGSTGEPKGVLNTQRMLCSNQKAIATLWPFVSKRPPVVVDWLPWSHTFGANHNLNLVLYHGGTMFIDEGKPTADLIDKTVANLREVSPTLYFNVPRGFDVLLPRLERDEGVARALFRDLDALFYAAASLPPPLWERLEAISMRVRGERVAMLSAWGSTETSPMATTVHFDIRRAGVIGLPAPGTSVKLAPTLGKLELRVRGPNVTKGYWGRPDLISEALDEEGFFRMGDAGRLIDPSDPARGIAFDGRLAEDFKLASATWVRVGAVRQALVSAGAPLVQDAVITGHDRDDIGVLFIVDASAARALCPELPADAPLDALVRTPEVNAELARIVTRHNAEHTAESTRVARALALQTPLGIDGGEITDKGYVNQRAVLAHRHDEVAALYEARPPVLLFPRR